MKSLKILAVALSLSVASVASAGAIYYDAAVNGLSTPAGVTSFTATGGSLVVDTKNGVTFLGVTGGAAGTEIDINQSITIAFDQAVKLNTLSLALLFNGPEYGDTGEIAASLITPSNDTYYLKIVAENTAEWYKGVTLLDTITGGPTSFGGFGLFTLNNPFGNTLIDSLKLYPVSTGLPGNESDFGLKSFSVPDTASSLALMGLALIGLAGFARRVRR